MSCVEDPIFKTTCLKVFVYTVTSRMSILTNGLTTDVLNCLAYVHLLQITRVGTLIVATILFTTDTK